MFYGPLYFYTHRHKIRFNFNMFLWTFFVFFFLDIILKVNFTSFTSPTLYLRSVGRGCTHTDRLRDSDVSPSQLTGGTQVAPHLRSYTRFLFTSIIWIFLLNRFNHQRVPQPPVVHSSLLSRSVSYSSLFRLLPSSSSHLRSTPRTTMYIRSFKPTFYTCFS